MRKWLQIVGSPKLALVGMVWLGIGAGLSYGNPMDVSIWVLVAPLAFMAVTLLCAIFGYPRIHRQTGLLVFHVGLLAIVVLAALGRLTFFEARVEMLEGNLFNAQDLLDVRQGRWHRGKLSEVEFVQGPYRVEYSAGLVRGRTFNDVAVRNRVGEWETRVIGDDRVLVMDGYRFYTSFNKGYAPLLTWQPDGGSEPVSGAVHMPSYPMFAHKQDQIWQPPQGPALKLWLRLETGLQEDQAWVLNGQPVRSVLVVTEADKRHELLPGQAIAVAGGTVRYEKLLTWMGYKIFYDPTLHWMFAASVLSVAGLGWHFWRRFGDLRAAALASTPIPAQIGSEGAWPTKPVPVRGGS